jgi:S-ribosylhomocysteine lyase
MGCRTGFYLSLWGEKSVEEVRDALVLSLQDIMKAEEVPAANAIQCGNYRDLSLFGAKEYTSKILSEGISTSIYGEDR